MSSSSHSRWATLVVLVLVLLAGWLRIEIADTWRAPAGDGVQYYKLSQELLLHDRLAFGPPPQPLGFTRMPGYPLFLAYAAVRKAPISLQQHLVHATAANLMLDAGTATLVAMMAGLLWPGVGGLGVALLLTMLCPLLVLLSCYGLSESLATFLTASQIYLLLRLWFLGSGDRRWPWLAMLAGASFGLGLLTRGDAVLLLPAAGLTLVRAAVLRGRRLRAVLLYCLPALMLYSPWPVRNLQQFRQPYWFSWYWRTTGGAPLPLSPIRWARTWATGAPGESFLDVCFAVQNPVDPNRPGVLLPWMYDDEAERAQLVRVLRLYNAQHFSPAVQAQFDALADARWRRHPLRIALWLPLRRLRAMWSPVPEYELPMQVPFLKLPERRWALGAGDGLISILALLGALRLWWGGRRRRHAASLLLVVVGARSLVLPFLVPIGLTERHLIEAYPALLVLASHGTVATAAMVAALLSRARTAALRRLGLGVR